MAQNKRDIERELRVMLLQRFGALEQSVDLGRSICTFDQWQKKGFYVKRGQKAFPFYVDGEKRFYFWWKQVYDFERYNRWKKRQKAEQKELLESGGILA